MSHSPTSVTNENVDKYSRAWSQLNRLVRAGESWSGQEKNCGFLNLGGKRFANVSAVTGVDFPDDGRSMALVDWDHDGDMDVWVTNRTAPRVRFLRNDLPSGNHFLAIRLQSKTANRDAIGARVEVILSGAGESRLVNTLKAGEGFRGQSSKWVHFGLGTTAAIERVEVRWPGGATETFTGIEPDRHFLLSQGTGQAEQWDPPAAAEPLVASTFATPEPTAVARTLLLHRTPLPALKYQDLASQAAQVSDHFTQSGSKQPLLVSLWSESCRPCRVELNHITKRADEIRAAGLGVLALSVDGIEDSAAEGMRQAKQVIEQLRFPFPVGMASADLVNRIQFVVDGMFGRDIPLAVPINLLFDEEGSLAAIYRGKVELDQILEDALKLPLADEELRAAATPLTGKWLDSFKADSYIVSIASTLQKQASPQEALAYVQSNIEHAKRDSRYGQMLDEIANRLHARGRLREAAAKYREAIAADPKLATPRVNLGLILSKQKKFGEAVKAYQNALALSPEDFEIHFHLANALLRVKRSDGAVRHLQQSIALKPSYFQAHFLLGNILVGKKDFAKAAEHFQHTLDIQPQLHRARFALGIALLQAGNRADGIAKVREAATKNPQLASALNNNAWHLATNPNPEIRNAQVALALAEVAAELSGHKQAASLDTLAAAQAAAGEFEQAVTTAEQGAKLAQDAGQQQMARDIRSRLELYRQGKPYVAPVPKRATP